MKQRIGSVDGMKYAIAMKRNGYEEYLQEEHGDDCFSDDIGNAILFHNWRNIPLNALDPGDYIVKVDEDDEGGIWVAGAMTEEEMKSFEITT